nr:type VI secretion system baseplate subunit TssG [uncultured Bartonella sp.]
MASEDRTSAADLSGFLCANARQFSAFELIELMEDVLDEGKEVGTHELAADEKILFSVDAGLSFPTSDVARVKELPPAQRRKSPRYNVEVTFMGLHGSGTVLPSYFAEQIAQYDQDDSTTKDFFDFFHNRLIGLLYRAWRKPRYSRRYRPQGTDKFSSWIFQCSAWEIQNPEVLLMSTGPAFYASQDYCQRVIGLQHSSLLL